MGSAKFNWNSINQKIGHAVKNSGTAAKGQQQAIEAGNKFVDTIHRDIGLLIGGYSSKVVSALQGYDISAPRFIGRDSDGGETWVIDVIQTNDMHRESLIPEWYPRGAENLGVLYDEGTKTHHPVFTLNDEGEVDKISNSGIAAYHFINASIGEFVKENSNKYKSLDVVEI